MEDDKESEVAIPSGAYEQAAMLVWPGSLRRCLSMCREVFRRLHCEVGTAGSRYERSGCVELDWTEDFLIGVNPWWEQGPGSDGK